MKRIARVTITTVASLLLAMGTATAANAATPTLQPRTTSGSQETTDTRGQHLKNELEQLAKTQTLAEAQAIWDTPGPTTGYFDDQGNLLAAEPTPDASVSIFAIAPVGPGCTTTSACIINTSSVHYGYDGTGSLAISVANSQTLEAGSISTVYTRDDGATYAIDATKEAVLATPGTIVNIAR
jgi:hypothetical protein